MKLDRKKIIIGIVIVTLIIIGILFYLFLMNQEGETIGEKTRNLFPFGEVTTPDFGNDGQGTIDTDDDGVQDTIDTELPEADVPRLRRISDFPTGGFVPIIRTEQEEHVEVTNNEDGSSTENYRVVDVENQYVRYSAIDDATVYETQVTPTELTQEILVDNFIPNAEKAIFSPDGNRMVLQYWNTEQHLPETYLARIEKIVMKIEPCPFDFSPIELGDDEPRIIGLHAFLNRNPQTRVARTGFNSPGNETSLVTEATLTAIKNFQSLYQISIDGKIGPETKERMTQVCDGYQERIAREAFENLKRKYTISGFFLPQNITTLAMNPMGDKLFYLRQDNVGVIGIVRDLLTEAKETIFESPFSEWTGIWENPDAIEITTKPSYAALGYSYRLDPLTGRYFKSLPEKYGLTVLPSPDGTKLLTMEIKDEKPLLSVYSRTSNSSRPLGIETFTDKCTWSSNSKTIYCGVPDSLSYDGQYPDVWYQGLEDYSDELWKIDATTYEKSLVSDLVFDYGAHIDINQIDVDDKDDFLYFIDKRTEFLWSYRLVDY